MASLKARRPAASILAALLVTGCGTGGSDTVGMVSPTPTATPTPAPTPTPTPTPTPEIGIHEYVGASTGDIGTLTIADPGAAGDPAKVVLDGNERITLVVGGGSRIYDGASLVRSTENFVDSAGGVRALPVLTYSATGSSLRFYGVEKSIRAPGQIANGMPVGPATFLIEAITDRSLLAAKGRLVDPRAGRKTGTFRGEAVGSITGPGGLNGRFVGSVTVTLPSDGSTANGEVRVTNFSNSGGAAAPAFSIRFTVEPNGNTLIVNGLGSSDFTGNFQFNNFEQLLGGAFTASGNGYTLAGSLLTAP